MLVSGFFSYAILPVLVEAKEGNATSDYASTAPQYSILFEKMLRLEQEGEILAALRIIPAIYATEIPVDSFYGALEQKREQLLDSVIQKDIPIPAGNSKLTITELRQLFTDYFRQPETYLHEIEIKNSGDLDLARFYLDTFTGYIIFLSLYT